MPYNTFKLWSVFEIFLIVTANLLSFPETKLLHLLSKDPLAIGPCSKTPENFPLGIRLQKTTFKNWNEEIVSKDLWEVIPYSLSDVIAVINWAFVHGYKIRVRGSGFSWSPMTVLPNSDCTTVMLIDLKRHFTAMHIENSNNFLKYSDVRVQTGTTMNSLLQFLENIDRGVIHTPVVGDITVGGAFALATHGFGASAVGEIVSPGSTYGSLSNTIISLTAIVWDSSVKQYVAKEFFRKDKETKAFLCHLGRTLVIDYVIRVGRNYNLRCVTQTKKPGSDLFSLHHKYEDSGRPDYSDFLNATGRLQTITFLQSTIKEDTFLRVCSVSDVKPKESLEVVRPYNYPYLDSIPAPVSDIIKSVSILTRQKLTPTMHTVNIVALSAAISATRTNDLWGLSKNHLLFIKPTVLRITTSAYVVITKRKNVQYVIHDFVSFHLSLLYSYAKRNEYPMSNPLEIRVTGLDDPEDVLIKGAQAPTLSPSTPFPQKPDFDTAVYFDLTTFPDSPYLFEYMEKIESFLFARFNGQDALVRPEWSKPFAFTKLGPYTNLTIMKTIIPEAYENGNQGWHWTSSVFNFYDPHSIFTNEFLDNLFN